MLWSPVNIIMEKGVMVYRNELLFDSCIITWLLADEQYIQYHYHYLPDPYSHTNHNTFGD